MVLKAEGLADWRVEFTRAGAYCWRDRKLIQLLSGRSRVAFLHEVAHALHPEPEGEHKNHYHGGGWADVFGRLVDRYMIPRS
jgi:hypothetical protein